LAPSDETKRAALLDRWAATLKKESEHYLKMAPWISKSPIESIFLGGGTSALLREHHLALLLSHIRENYTLAENCEITLEGNPDNFYDPAYLEMCLSLGFNRFSLGVQSLQDEVNLYAGRGHDRTLTLRAVSELLKTKKPFNVDLIYGMPFQTPTTFANDVKTLIELQVPTITTYRLRNNNRKILHLGTTSVWNRFDSTLNQKVTVRKTVDGQAKEFPSFQETYEMREQAMELLYGDGYRPSPACFWSRPNTYQVGNIPAVYRNKWQNFDDQIAFGPGVYGWFTTGKGTVIQTHNTLSVHDYLKQMDTNGNALDHGRELSGPIAAAAALAFSFKSMQPILNETYAERFGVNLRTDEPFASVLNSMVEAGFLTDDGKALRTTPVGEALHEEIVDEFFHKRIGGYARLHGSSEKLTSTEKLASASV